MDETEVRRLISEEMAKRPGPRLPEPLERRMRAAENAEDDNRFNARVDRRIRKVLAELVETLKERET